MITRHEINEVANHVGVRVDSLSDHVAKMVILGAVLPGGLSVEQQTEARVDAAFAKVAAAPAIQQRRDGCESNRVVRFDGVDDVAGARQRARHDSENAWRQPLRSAYVAYDQSDYRAPEGDSIPAPVDPELEAGTDSEDQPPDPAAARSRSLRASEREWMQPLSAGLRLPR